jgi:membrane protein DedA with SNARE-associated domain/membrane-associated phospholipid phosphatase
VAGVLATAALAVYSTGLVHPPNIEQAAEDLGTALGSWTYLLVGLMAFLETGAFVGLIAPGETFILVGGLVAGQGQISIVVLIGIVWTAAVAGDVTSFVLGRRLGRQFMLRHGERFKITEERLEMVERFYARHGGKAVFLGRFVGLIRAISPFVAGSSGMSLRRFLPYDIVGAGIWGGGLCVLGFVFWRSFDKVATYASRGLLALGTVIVVVGGGIVAYRWLKVPEHRAQVHAWLHEQAERPLLRPFARVARPVVWRVLAPIARFLSGPLRFAGGRLTPGELGLELTTLLAVVSVGGFTFVALADMIGNGPTMSDERAFDVVARIDETMVIDAAKVLTVFGSLPAAIAGVAAAAVLLLRRHHVTEVVVLATGLLSTYIGVHVWKAVVDRPRPSGALVETAGSSFPSGHAAYAIVWVAIAVALARGVPGLAGRAGVLTIALVFAAAIGLTRVVLQVHYLTDVLAGWALGATIFALCGVAGLLVEYVRHNARSR